MTITALKESLKNAEIELSELDNNPNQMGFIRQRSEINEFIKRMKRELHAKYRSQNL